MPSLLHYTVVTDPTSLPAPQPGAPSVGAVYVIVSNTHQSEVRWEYIDVEIPVGSGPSDLTDDPAVIIASADPDYTAWLEPVPDFGWDAGLGRFRARHPQGGRLTLPYDQSLVLKLEGIPVSGAAGLVRVRVLEKSGGGDDNVPMRRDHFTTTLGLVKQAAPRIPRNFRPDRNSLADVDAGGNVILKWDGPDNLDYWIRDPEGNETVVATAAQGSPVTQQAYMWSPIVPPKRGTTYTLVAGTRGPGQPEQGYFLTTTVHALVPEFGSGTRTPWVEGTVNQGRITFSADGAEIRNGSGGWGTVHADKADVDGVTTTWVRGRGADDGWIEFPETGLNVFHGQQKEWGVVHADKADVNGVNTKWVQGRGADDGRIEFPESGLDVFHGQGRDWGVVHADKADLNGVNTKWVQGRGADDGWIEFPGTGLNVFHGSGREWGNVHADKADVNGVNTKWVQGRDTGDGWIDFPKSGVRVFADGQDEWGTLKAGKADLDDLVTGEAVVRGHLAVGGGMKLSHEGEPLLLTLPDRIVFQGINDFQKWVTFADGLAVTYSKTGSVWISKAAQGLIVRGDFQVEGGNISVSKGNPPQVRTL
ncbi:hypothetical protein [Streptomyces liangshanensis]|uniref:Uncharacterized protein n=1 Tax=Streptomyces liangshanensis TaxID=2717324 RepID=A0A6G9H484_9ACTN|nr:hypothetical protein [Streptomyces liangshanensis]QIQ04927.1 hypothetical protein HA039_23955 [Streptomyces liangshanensis]